MNWIRSWVRDSEEEGKAYDVVLVGEEALKF